MKRRATTQKQSRTRSGRSALRGGRTSATRNRKTANRRSSAKITTDHEKIRQWAEKRGGHPATVKGRLKRNQRAGILRIDFPGFRGERSLEAVSWDDWFQIFDERRLGFLHQERTASGKISRFNKLTCRD